MKTNRLYWIVAASLLAGVTACKSREQEQQRGNRDTTGLQRPTEGEPGTAPTPGETTGQAPSGQAPSEQGTMGQAPSEQGAKPEGMAGQGQQGQQGQQGTVSRDVLFSTPETDLANLAGRPVSITQPVTVTRVVSDRVFYVRDASTPDGHEVLVQIDQQQASQTPIKQGDTISSLRGDLQKVQASELQQWGLSKAQQQTVKQAPIAIHATQISKGGGEPANM